MADTPSTIRIAILGGGIAGAAVLRGLLRYPHIAVDMYESRPAVWEEGLGITLTSNAGELLRAIDPSLSQCLERAGAVHSRFECRMATGPYAGQRVQFAGNNNPVRSTIDQQALLQELLSGVPPHVVHPTSHVSSITESRLDGGVLLTFADGSHKNYDVLIGADGVHGQTRQFVLGSHDPASRPEYSGIWGVPIKVPFERARQAMGPEFLDPGNPCQMVWIGEGTLMQHEFINNCQEIQLSFYVRQDEVGDGSPWARLLTSEEFEEIFARNEIPVCQRMVGLVRSVYTVQLPGISQMQHKPARTYVTRNACLIGDSAHSMTFLQGGSVVISLEEAFVLSTLLGRATSRAALPYALSAFDQMCRPRGERGLQCNLESGYILTGTAPGVGVDMNRISDEMRDKFAFLTRLDIMAYQAAAINTMDRLLARDGLH